MSYFRDFGSQGLAVYWLQVGRNLARQTAKREAIVNHSSRSKSPNAPCLTAFVGAALTLAASGRARSGAVHREGSATPCGGIRHESAASVWIGRGRGCCDVNTIHSEHQRTAPSHLDGPSIQSPFGSGSLGECHFLPREIEVRQRLLQCGVRIRTFTRLA